MALDGFALSTGRTEKGRWCRRLQSRHLARPCISHGMMPETVIFGDPMTENISENTALSSGACKALSVMGHPASPLDLPGELTALCITAKYGEAVLAELLAKALVTRGGMPATPPASVVIAYPENVKENAEREAQGKSAYPASRNICLLTDEEWKLALAITASN